MGKSKPLAGAKRKAPAKRKAAPKRKTAARKKVAKKTSRKKATKRKSVRRYKAVTRCVPVKRKKAAKKGKMTKARRVAAAKKGAATRRRNAKKGSYKRNGKRSYARRKGGGTHPRVVRRKARRKSYRKNNFMANLKQVLKTGAFVAGGFLSHKVITGLACTMVFDKMMPAASPTMQTWKKPICGLAVLAIGIPVARSVVKKNATEVTAGMAASFIQSAIVAALSSAGQEQWSQNLSGYSNSRAYGLRGGPTERNAASIMPRYDRLSGFQQAAAGFQQAAAGTGEYFSANATGEYFAPNSLEGVGSYEGAGQLAMQASAGVQDIDDGIRPDSDIDGIMDLAEAAAGLRGMGEFYSAVQASGGRVVEKRVGQKSEWVPNGPLWAGTDAVKDNQATSELSAGILQRQGGNGVLSAG